MEKYEPKKDCSPPNLLSRNSINSSPNNNAIFEQNKLNNFYQVGYQDYRNKYNLINENLKISIGITFNELESLTKEHLIQFIQFINYSCNLNLKDIKYSNCCCSIFEIKENLNRNGYNIVISKNELNSKFRNKIEDINENNIILENNEKLYNKISNENDDNFYLLKEKNDIPHNYCLPISCPIHNNIKFNSLNSYLIHCKEAHKIFICKDCGKIFEDFNNFKCHIYKILNIENENINIDIKDNDAPPLFKNLKESNNLEKNIKCTKCELIFDSVEKMSIHFYEAHEKKIIETSKINEEFLQNKNQSKNENVKECSLNRIEDNENEKKIENLNQKKEENIKSEEVKKESTLESGDEMKIIKEISKENSNKKESKYLQRKKNRDKEENEEEISIKKEEFKKKEKLKKQDDLKRQEELKRQKELNNQEDLKREEELKEIKVLKIKEELEKQENSKEEEEEEIKNDGFYFICCIDNKKFSTQNLYFEHFRKEHSVICCICGKEFESKYALKNHYNSKNNNHNIFKCKVCNKAFLTINAFKSHCKDKNH